jgi:hypothetical protein
MVLILKFGYCRRFCILKRNCTQTSEVWVFGKKMTRDLKLREPAFIKLLSPLAINFNLDQPVGNMPM